MVVTRADPFPKRYVWWKYRRQGRQLNFHYLNVFLVPSGFLSLEELSVSSLFKYSFSVLILDLERFTFIRALSTRFFPVQWRVNYVRTYFKYQCWLHDE